MNNKKKKKGKKVKKEGGVPPEPEVILTPYIINSANDVIQQILDLTKNEQNKQCR